MTQNTKVLVSTLPLSAIMILAGVAHLQYPAPFISIVPSFLPNKPFLVLFSGICEILGGTGILFSQSRKAAAIGLILLYICVFPANINMAVHQIPLNHHHFSPWILWLRLPLQFVLIWWAYACGRFGTSNRDRQDNMGSRTN